MPIDGRLIEKLSRTAHAGAGVLHATVRRPSMPLKVNFCLTYWCQYRCKTCNIWQRKPTDELTTDEVRAFVRENPDITWVDLTGGEIFLRPDIDEILDAVVTGWRRLALLHFPDQRLSDRSHRPQRRADRRARARADHRDGQPRRRRGDERRDSRHQGRLPAADRDVQARCARSPASATVFGVTLSSYNVGRFARDVRRVRARDSRADDRRHAPERGAGVRPLLRQRRRCQDCARSGADPSKSSRCIGSCRGVPRRWRSCSRPPICTTSTSFSDRHDADAVPCAARELLHRSVGRRLSVHHLLEADRAAARHRHAAGRIWNAPSTARTAARDLGGPVSAVLDRLRGVSEHSRQRPGRPLAGRRDGAGLLPLAESRSERGR